MGCDGTVGLSAGPRVAGGDCFWLRPMRPYNSEAGVHTQNWSLRYMHPHHPAHREGRTQQGAG